MTNTEPIMQTFYDGTTGESIVRELTPEEIAQLQEANNETPSPD